MIATEGESIATVTLHAVFNAKILVSCAVAHAILDSHVRRANEFVLERAYGGVVGVTFNVVVAADCLWDIRT